MTFPASICIKRLYLELLSILKEFSLTIVLIDHLAMAILCFKGEQDMLVGSATYLAAYMNYVRKDFFDFYVQCIRFGEGLIE